jgi:hypothetical protein
MARRRRPRSQSWGTFLANHLGQIVAADSFVVPTATYRLLFVLMILAHERRLTRRRYPAGRRTSPRYERRAA